VDARIGWGMFKTASSGARGKLKKNARARVFFAARGPAYPEFESPKKAHKEPCLRDFRTCNAGHRRGIPEQPAPSAALALLQFCVPSHISVSYY